MKISLLLLILQISFFTFYSLAQTKVTSIKARVISSNPVENDNSFDLVYNQLGAFSENMIDNPDFPLINTNADQIIVSVEYIDSENSGKDGIFRFIATSENKVVLKKERKLYTYGYSNKKIYYYILDDVNCSTLSLKAELIKNNKVVSTMTKKIEFECGE